MLSHALPPSPPPPTLYLSLSLIPRNRHCEADCITAKSIELQKLIDFHIYLQVEDLGQNCISTTWVLWKKENEVCARGFKEMFLKTIGKSTFRLTLLISACNNMVVKTIVI